MWFALAILALARAGLRHGLRDAQTQPACDACDQADPCFEAEIQWRVLPDVSRRENELLEVFTEVLQGCPTGQYPLQCVHKTFTADHPRAYLTACQQRVGFDAVNSGAVCMFAERKVQKLSVSAQQWASV